MGRTPGAKNKPKGETVQTATADHTMPGNYTEANTQVGSSPSQEVAIFQPARLPFDHRVEEKFGVDKGTWKVLVEAIFPAAKSVDSIVMALSYCKSRGLDIMKRPVHIVPMWDSNRGTMVETVWPGISELRTTASRTSGYAGCDEAEFGPDKTAIFKGRIKGRGGEWQDIGPVEVTYPDWCRLTVYRVIGGQRCKFVGPKVKWLETYATIQQSDVPNKMWQERPEGQLEKCAEAAALRRAFPEEMGNELTAEEMEGRRLHDADIATSQVTTGAARDQGPPRAVAPPAANPEQAHDGTPPPRKADPISSGPPRTAGAEPAKPAAKPADKPATKPSSKPPEPFRIPGTGHTFESWAEQYTDLLKTSPDTATVYKWIDCNTRPFKEGDGPEQAGPLTRLEKGKPSVYQAIRKATEQTMQALRDAQKKAEEKAAKKAAPSEMDDAPPRDMGGDTGHGFGGGMDDEPSSIRISEQTVDPEAILSAIDAELAAVEDPDSLQDVWDKSCEPLVAKLEFPPDQDAAQGLFNKHEKRLGGD